MKGFFKKNSFVQAIDDNFEGKVVSVRDNIIEVESSDGFVVRFRESELIPAVTKEDASKMGMVSHDVIEDKEKVSFEKKRRPASVKKQKVIPPMEVDLHIGKLVRNPRGMSNYDILTLQIETAKRQLEFARSKKIQRVVFIHGVGEGVLKEELNYLLRQYDNLKYYDADYHKYGLGATEVYFLQKGLVN